MNTEMKKVLGNHVEDFEKMVYQAYWNGVKQAHRKGIGRAESIGGA